MKVNGTSIRCQFPISLSSFLEDQQFDAQRIAVEKNHIIIPKADYDTVMLQDEDILEIVTFVGGG